MRCGESRFPGRAPALRRSIVCRTFLCDVRRVRLVRLRPGLSGWRAVVFAFAGSADQVRDLFT